MFTLHDKIYVRIDNYWFDLTNYKDHPGGIGILKKYHLKDATIDFNLIKGHSDAFAEGKLVEFEIKNSLLVGYLNLIFKN